LNTVSASASSNAPADPSARTPFLAAWIGLLALKLWLAARLPLFGDEAFYWLEGQHPAWAYSDLPGLTAWMARIGVALAGNTPLGLRWPFLLMGAALPWLCVRIARRWFDAEAGWRAGLIALLLPLASTLGVLALPDVPLVFATLLAFDACAALLAEFTSAACLQLAVALALGATSHYRFLIALFAGGVALVSLREGRALFRRSGFVLALAIGALGWLPLLVFNLDQHAAGLRFQLLDRNPWQFHLYALKLQLAQPLITGPLLYAGLLWVLWQSWRRRDDPRWRFLLIAGGLPLLVFVVLAPFLDIQRVSFHWPVTAYLLLSTAVPLLGARRRLAYAWVCASSALLTVALYGLLAVTTLPNGMTTLARWGFYPLTFAGWDAATQATRARLASMPRETLLVADNFMLAAELEFGFGGTRPVYVLDHPLNAKHGRALQLALWHRDEAALASLSRRPMLVVAEETMLDPQRREPWSRHLCALWPGLHALGGLDVDLGRKRFLFYSHQPGDHGRCDAPAFAYLARPLPDAIVSGQRMLAGWAFQDGVGVARVEVLLDGVPFALAHYGLEEPGVRSQWPGADDPNLPNVGFEAVVDFAHASPGRHALALRVTGRDGRVRVLENRSVRVVAAAAD
jgi:4-amino-4-deoxy-L-arabinose transferase-like glycosyltransferase